MKVRGTMEIVPPIHVDKDTVYIRSNVQRIEEDEFVGWEYDEVQYDKNEYMEFLASREDVTKLKKEQAQTNSTLLEFMENILLGGM